MSVATQCTRRRFLQVVIAERYTEWYAERQLYQNSTLDHQNALAHSGSRMPTEVRKAPGQASQARRAYLILGYTGLCELATAGIMTALGISSRATDGMFALGGMITFSAVSGAVVQAWTQRRT